MVTGDTLKTPVSARTCIFLFQLGTFLSVNVEFCSYIHTLWSVSSVNTLLRPSYYCVCVNYSRPQFLCVCIGLAIDKVLAGVGLESLCVWSFKG